MATLDDDDDGLPPPPPKPAAKPVVNLDEDDDELPPPPVKATPAAPAKPPTIDLDDDDGLPPPPPKPTSSPAAGAKAISLDDSDDELPPPPPKTAALPAAVAAPPAAAADETAAPPARGRSQAVIPEGTAAGDRPASPSSKAARSKTTAVVRRNVNDVYKEGFLFKQSPTWPYASQKRWCTLKGRLLSYFESQGAGAPAGTLELKGAELTDVSKTAKMPNSFGLTGPSGPLKGRVFIFSTSTREDYQSWVETLQAVMTEPKASDLHWFEKMAQGMF